ncbi:hypothetical protein CAOG_02197 [Capsaspora owczarzaki ATCC 30864]|uniref:hypothetical protein n=1 Tax=Capsaspora owczarzaki (strain ATCC 30864) TaxID=595528 RepID=UPI00035226CE|nr:hypothetical protein CAOG_02197 [Capsaspora owczarzaki ATCC 30864]|eukprot:XP_004348947.2 hypothetical protein CAOG_02197 [Capsaspora owczarzaki ATCC 30864]
MMASSNFAPAMQTVLVDTPPQQGQSRSVLLQPASAVSASASPTQLKNRRCLRVDPIAAARRGEASASSATAGTPTGSLARTRRRVVMEDPDDHSNPASPVSPVTANGTFADLGQPDSSVTAPELQQHQQQQPEHLEHLDQLDAQPSQLHEQPPPPPQQQQPCSPQQELAMTVCDGSSATRVRVGSVVLEEEVPNQARDYPSTRCVGYWAADPDYHVLIRIIPKATAPVAKLASEVAVSLQLADVPGVVHLVDCFEDADNHYLVQEHCPDPRATSLLDFVMQNGRLHEWVALELFERILQTVSDVHERGVALCNLSLDAFVLVPEQWDPEQPWLSSADAQPISHPKMGPDHRPTVGLRPIFHDLCAAMLAQPDTLLCEPFGAAAYMSPDIFACRPYSPMASDAWALGVILFALVTGGFPFNSAVPPMLVNDARRGHFSTINGLSAGVQHLVHALLNPVAARRATVAEALAMVQELRQTCFIMQQSHGALYQLNGASMPGSSVLSSAFVRSGVTTACW